MRISLSPILLTLLCCLLPHSGRAQTERSDTLSADSLVVVIADETAESKPLVSKSDSLLKAIGTAPQLKWVENSEKKTEGTQSFIAPRAQQVAAGDTLYEFDEEALLEALSQLTPNASDHGRAQKLNLEALVNGTLSPSSSLLSAANDSTLYEVDEEMLIETLRQLAVSQRQQTRVGKKLSADELLRYQLLIQLLTRPNAQASVTTESIYIEVPTETPRSSKAKTEKDKAKEKQEHNNDLLYALGAGVNAIGDVAVLSELKQNATATNERLQALETQQAALLQYLQQRDSAQVDTMVKTTTPIVFPSTKTIEVPADFKRSVFFLVGSSTLSAQSEATLDEAVRFLHRFPKILFDLQGFASPDGSVQRNLQLGKERIDAVFRYLEAKGIGAERLRTATYGQIDYASQQQLGRRVDISLIVP